MIIVKQRKVLSLLLKNKTTIIAGVAAVVLFVILSISVVRGDLAAWDNSIYHRISHWASSGLTDFMIFISFLGEWFVYVIVAGLLLIFAKTRWRIGLPLLLAVSIAGGLGLALKEAFAIVRPDFLRLVTEVNYSYPSNHALLATVFTGVLVYLLFKYNKRIPLRIAAVVIAIIFCILMGISRVYLGVHNPTDILAGYLVGIIVVAVTIIIVNSWSRSGAQSDTI
jgi:undecaprenyl-diphosphatase